jgi:PAS domain S-box-containing protein
MVRLDEAAQPLHDVMPVKLFLNVVAGLAGLPLIPAPYCIGWIAVGFAIELWTWSVTRNWPAPGTVPPRRRANFAASYVCMNAWWLLLAALFWQAGGVAGHAVGAAAFMIIASVTVLLFYNVPAVFFAGGAAPVVGALVVLCADRGGDWRQMLPLWVVLIIGAIFTLGRAIETPSAQLQQRRINRTLADYETLTENVTDVISRTDLNGVFEYVSPAALRVLGYQPSELIGLSRWSLAHPDTLRAALHRMSRDPESAEALTLRMRHKDGHWVWLQSRSRVIFEDGVAVGVIDTSRDVTAQVAAEGALRAAKAEAEAASRAKGEFLANVSHEIRTPLNGVLGALHLLQDERLSAEGRQLIRSADDCGRMLAQLLNDVLDFSKIEAGQLELAPEPVDLLEALRGVAGLLDGQAKAKGLELKVEAAEADYWVEADPLRVRQAFFNLIGNAVKFTNAGHILARLTISDGEDGRRQVRLDVEDTGIGMTPATQARLFERFHQAEGDAARRFGGAGLGLSITRALARMMGGDITFASEAGKGSTFTFSFVAPAARSAGPSKTEAGALEDLRILLVEDNATNRMIARAMLARLGAAVEEAQDGIEGLEAAKLSRFDLILMDIQMPRMSGIEATRAIRALPGEAGRTPIIALTANAMTHQAAEYLAAGVDGVVAKPISAASLLQAIAQLVDDRRTGELAASS